MGMELPHEKRGDRTMKLATFGSNSYEMGGLAVSLATITGSSAGLGTLMVDLSEKPGLAWQRLGLSDATLSLEALVNQFTHEAKFSTPDVLSLVTPVYFPWESRPPHGFDLLAGPLTPTPGYIDQLVAQRGENFAQQLLSVLSGTDYALVVVNLGKWIDTLCGEAVVQQADLTVIGAERDAEISNLQAARGRKYYQKPGSCLALATPLGLQYPDSDFFNALEHKNRRDKYAEECAPRLALACAEYLFPDIRSRLKDASGKKIRPYR